MSKKCTHINTHGYTYGAGCPYCQIASLTAEVERLREREQFAIAPSWVEERPEGTLIMTEIVKNALHKAEADAKEQAAGVLKLADVINYLNGMVVRGNGSDIVPDDVGMNIKRYIQLLECNAEQAKAELGSLRKQVEKYCLKLEQAEADATAWKLLAEERGKALDRMQAPKEASDEN